mgnify:FL=1
MADKLSSTDLRRAVMARTGASEKEVALFHNALKEQIIAALRQDNQVKINGLGTFRLQAISPRKSVNIATGESITIEGYNKLAFVPEVSVKELVGNNPLPKDTPAPQQPTSKKQPGNEFDPLKKLGEQADEIVDILATLGQGPKAQSETNEPVSTTSPDHPASVSTEQAPTTPTSTSPLKEENESETIAPKETTPQEKTPVETIEIEPVVSTTSPKKEEKKQQKTAKPKRKYHFLRDTLICVSCLLLVLVGGYIFLRETLSQWVDSLREQPDTEMVAVENTTPIDTIETAKDTTTLTSEITEDAESTSTPLTYTKFIATERVRNGSRLAQIARRHYGEDKMDLWVYIYDANRDIIGNPNAIKVGTELRVPHLTEQQMDLTNPDTQAQIAQLKAQIGALGK